MMPMPTRGGADNIELAHESFDETEIKKPKAAICARLVMLTKDHGAPQKPIERQTASAAHAEKPMVLAAFSEIRPLCRRHSASSAPQTSPPIRVSKR